MVDPDLEIIEMKNIGPFTVRILNAIGNFTVKDLLNHEYPQIRDKMIKQGNTPNLLMFYSIDMGL